MNPSDAAMTECETEHGLLIAFGEFAQSTGLIADLMRVRIPQKIQHHAHAVSSQTKLVELYAGLLAGIEYLQDLSLGAHPLVKDSAVAEAWKQTRFVHYSNVSRTLEVCNALTVQDVRAVIERFNQPFIAEAIHDELRTGREIVLDLDLMGQSVSSTSQTYPDAAFGWMAKEVRLGYQLARVCVQTVRYGRIWLDGFHHPGDTVSVNCLKELVLAAEQRSGVHPRRRSELVTGRIEALQPTRQRLDELCRRHTAVITALQDQQTEWLGQRYALEQRLKKTSVSLRKEPFSKQIASLTKRLDKLPAHLTYRQAVLDRAQVRRQKVLAEQAHLQAWRTQLEQDNQQNPNAPSCVCRQDAGFCSDDNLTWQIEMGYQVETKSTSGKLTTALQSRCSNQTPWTRVGDNAVMTDWSDYPMHQCPYPLRVGLERFQLGPQTKHRVLIMSRDTHPWPTLPQWFQHYNGRQTIEAGNKQMKTVYHVQHLMSHAKYGIQIQVLLSGLACNQTQFVQPWLQSAAEKLTPHVEDALTSPKTLVRVLANSTANVQRSTCSTILVFAQTSSTPGLKLCLRGLPLHQLNLGLFQPVQKR